MSRSEAAVAQLNAEIKGAGMTGKEMATRLGIHPNVFYRYTAGITEMPMRVLYAAIEVLGIDEVEFFRRAYELRNRR
jgi:Helix-turn-helix.